MSTTQHRPQVWAHRGDSSRYPENTMAAFRAALDAGADGIELDVHWSADKEIVVIHDPDVSRTTNGQGLVSELAWSTLQQLDAGITHGNAFEGERIPSLNEVLELIASYPRFVVLNIELKRQASRHMDPHVLARVHHYGLDAQVIYSSFDHVRLRDIRRDHPGARIGLLYDEYLVDPWLYAQYLGADALHPIYVSIDEALVQKTTALGIAVHVWTVNDPEVASRLAAWGVNAIMTDYPLPMLTHIQQLTAQPGAPSKTQL